MLENFTHQSISWRNRMFSVFKVLERWRGCCRLLMNILPQLWTKAALEAPQGARRRGLYPIAEGQTQVRPDQLLPAQPEHSPQLKRPAQVGGRLRDGRVFFTFHLGRTSDGFRLFEQSIELSAQAWLRVMHIACISRAYRVHIACISRAYRVHIDGG
jgi:hypothetical protein